MQYGTVYNLYTAYLIFVKEKKGKDLWKCIYAKKQKK